MLIPLRKLTFCVSLSRTFTWNRLVELQPWCCDIPTEFVIFTAEQFELSNVFGTNKLLPHTCRSWMVLIHHLDTIIVVRAFHLSPVCRDTSIMMSFDGEDIFQ